jgi:hypothetical protein
MSGGAIREQPSPLERCLDALAQSFLGVAQETCGDFLAANFEQQGQGD